jgi:3-methylcrotonyl-CoA carboxylase alpha subunit
MKRSYTVGDQLFDLQLFDDAIVVDGQRVSVEWLEGEVGDWQLEIDGHPVRVRWAKRGRHIWLHMNGRTFHFEKAAGGHGAGAAGGSADRILRAPMPGQVRAVYVEAGQAVEEGQELLLLEAMKMEIRIQAPRAAQVAAVNVGAGDSVDKDQVLVELDDEDQNDR